MDKQMNAISISKQESSLLSLLRILATGSIVVCHILQTLDNNWAYIFNIGVQVFFVLSGYLYGHKTITGWGSWFKGRFQKLYIPFIIIVLFFIILYLITGLFEVTPKILLVYVFNLQGLIGGGYKSIGHLWFMTAIALCYVITPILQRLKKYSTLCVLVLLASCSIEYYIYTFQLNIFSWLFLYSMGYFLAISNRPQRLFIIIISFAMFVIAMGNISWTEIKDGAIRCIIMHNCAGIFLVYLFSLIGRHIDFDIKCKPLTYLDSLSYYAYIVHMPFVRPPHHMLDLTDCLALNILVITVIIIVLSYIMKKICDCISMYLNNHRA